MFSYRNISAVSISDHFYHFVTDTNYEVQSSNNVKNAINVNSRYKKLINVIKKLINVIRNVNYGFNKIFLAPIDFTAKK